MAGTGTKAPWHLWVVGIFAILFNAIGVFDYVMAHVQGSAYLASAGMSPEQVDYYEAMPAWVTAAWATGVFAAFIASALLLARRRIAFHLFLLSLAALVVNLAHTYALTDGGKVMGGQMAVTSAVIAFLLALFAIYAGKMGERGVLR